MTYRLPLILLLACAGLARAQGDPVSWQAKAPAAVTAGQVFQVEAAVTIEAPYHIYGLEGVDLGTPTTFKVSGGEGRVVLAGKPKPSRPPKVHVDPQIGDYTYWESKLTIEVPLKVTGTTAADSLSFDLVMEYQACDDTHCLPPAEGAKGVLVEVKEAQEPETQTSLTAEPEDRYPVRVKGVEVGPVDKGRFTVVVTLTIDGDYYIYGLEDPTGLPTSFSLSENERLGLVGPPEPSRPATLHDEDPDYPHTSWKGEVSFSLPLGIKDAEVGQTVSGTLDIELMACDKDGCLPPTTLAAPIEVTVEEGGAGDGLADGASTETRPVNAGGEEAAKKPARALAVLDGDATPGRVVDILIPLGGDQTPALGSTVEEARIVLFNSDLEASGDGRVEGGPEGLRLRVPVLVHSELSDKHPLAVDGVVTLVGGSVPFTVQGLVHQPLAAFIILAMLAALVALLTPCVFPMIPITVSFFTKQAEASHHKPVTLGIVYCLGIVLSFVALGVVFTLVLGAGGASAFAQSPITLAAIGILFVVFALSLFGMFDLQLPPSVMKLVGSAQGKGGTLGVWLLGLLFAVTTFTCTAPFVGSILASAAASGQWTRPVLGMVAFSGVLAVPFFFLSVFPARLKSLPRAGSWLNEVKVVMGFVELAAAFKFFGDMDGTVVFTRPMILCAWAAFSLACGLYLLGVFRLPHDSPKERVGVLGMLVALLCLGFAFYLTRGFSGDPLHAQIDVYLPRESVDRTPVGRRLALIKEMRSSLGGVGGTGGHQEPKGRVGYDAHYRNAYEDARAEAKRLGMPLFVDFTGFA